MNFNVGMVNMNFMGGFVGGVLVFMMNNVFMYVVVMVVVNVNR